MESKPPIGGGAAPRKVRFAPKAPPTRKPKPAAVKIEVKDDDDDDSKAKDLLRRFNEGILKGKAKVERKVAPSQIAFGYGGAVTSIKSYGTRSKASNGNNHQGSFDGSFLRMEKEYQEPWDYYTYYPVTLPLRRPYSGNPELLDEEEFGEASETATFDENLTNSAEELGLVEENLEPSMFFIQLPPSLPMMKRSASSEGEEITESSKSSRKGCKLDDLPAGFMGKMLVHRSGAIKLKLGDSLYDVSVGSNCVFAQDAVAMNIEDKHCCVVGELNKRAVVTPDVDSILDGIDQL
ncbi:uncharacterized protein LOC116215905 [Punica granatum]|uniref:Uncharacterized protein LOC116215905 n=2 Tax=Punica granatum TaxID=22663 RepID=A0A6P8EMP8_PUNGR|nr:uncharacterized protein LOC116215905 [Punica granatum]PKI38980.1 hypothetical protein CRG98_040632 [Punica granatum]